MIWSEAGRKPMAIQRHFFFKRGPSVCPSLLTPSMHNIIKQCLSFQPEKRPSAGLVLAEYKGLQKTSSCMANNKQLSFLRPSRFF